MTTRDQEFLELFDGLVLRVLCRICGPARDHFVDPEEKMPKLVRMTNATSEQVMASLCRLVGSGRVTPTRRRLEGKFVFGITCLPQREWENPREPVSRGLSLTPTDVRFLRDIGVQVDQEDMRDPVEV